MVNAAQLFDLVESDMVQMDQKMAHALTADHPYLQEFHQFVLSNPGKRLRPTLLFLCSKMLGYEGDLSTTYATVFELIHSATLIHDDVIDGAVVRRGKPTLNKNGQNTMTVLYGDLLYTKANSLAIDAGSLRVLKIISDVTEKMIEGELLQEKVNFDLNQDRMTYFEIMERKTAHLFAGTTETAGIIAELEDSKVSKLHHFGFHLGVSFQIIDDLLDYTVSQEQLGKPVLNDLRDGKLTLPMHQLLEAEPFKAKKLVTEFWAAPSDEHLNEILDLLQKHNILQQVKKTGMQHAQKAIGYLNEFPENIYSQILHNTPTFLANRRR